MKIKDEKAIFLIYKKQQEALTAKETALLDAWLNQNTENAKKAEQLLAQFEDTESLVLPEFKNKARVWQKIQKQMVTSEKKKEKAFIASLSPAWTYALVFLCLLGLGYRFFLYPVQIIATQKGERTHHVLADGSSFDLNSQSRIQFSNSFGKKNRIVTLSGEAFFQVEKGAFPFIVKTGQGICTVTGTKFNVRAREQETILSVEEGQVKFQNKKSIDSTVVVEAHQISEVQFDKAPTSPRMADAQAIAAWREGVLVFKQAPVKEVIKELERFYDIVIKMDTTTVKKKTLTATMNQLTADQAVGSICQTLKLQYQKEGKTYHLH